MRVILLYFLTDLSSEQRNKLLVVKGVTRRINNSVIVDGRKVTALDNDTYQVEQRLVSESEPSLFSGAKVREVVIEDQILHGRDRPRDLKQGVYEYGSATAEVRTSILPDRTYVTEIVLVGDNLKSAQKLYNDIRSGKIKPKVEWTV